MTDKEKLAVLQQAKAMKKEMRKELEEIFENLYGKNSNLKLSHHYMCRVFVASCGADRKKWPQLKALFPVQWMRYFAVGEMPINVEFKDPQAYSDTELEQVFLKRNQIIFRPRDRVAPNLPLGVEDGHDGNT